MSFCASGCSAKVARGGGGGGSDVGGGGSPELGAALFDKDGGGDSGICISTNYHNRGIIKNQERTYQPSTSVLTSAQESPVSFR